MKPTIEARLEKIATYHDERAAAVRTALDELRSDAKQRAATNGHATLQAAIVIRRKRRKYTRRQPLPTAQALASKIRAAQPKTTDTSGKAVRGTGIGVVVKEALKDSPGSTAKEIWPRINGKFATSSANPRGLLSVTLRRMLKDGHASEVNGKWYLK